MKDKIFNSSAAYRQLSGAQVALDDCVRKLESGEYDEEGLHEMSLDFEHVLYHLCLAWHYKDMTDERRSSLSKEDILRLARTVPNFGFELKLMDGIDGEV